MKGGICVFTRWRNRGQRGAEITGLSDAENLGAAGVKLRAVAVL